MTRTYLSSLRFAITVTEYEMGVGQFIPFEEMEVMTLKIALSEVPPFLMPEKKDLIDRGRVPFWHNMRRRGQRRLPRGKP